MTAILAGLVIFSGVHSISIINDAWRNRAATRYRERAWRPALPSASGSICA